MFVLSLAAVALLIGFGASVDKLIPLYAFGVFVSFTLSQGGMVVHWLRLREPGWRKSIAINGVGAVATAVVAAIIGGTKFLDGAWMSILLMVILGVAFMMIRRHYRSFEEQVDIGSPTNGALEPQGPRPVVVPVGELNAASRRAIEYACTISPQVMAVHVAADREEAKQFDRRWQASGDLPPLTIIESPGLFLAPMLAYLDALQERESVPSVVVLPQLVSEHFWDGFLHNQTATRLKKALAHRPGTIVVEVPYLLEPNGRRDEAGRS
jgi:FAD/FMN-containing dehydrogenase